MIVDDHSIVRIGLGQILDQSGEFEVVGQAADGEEAVRVAADVSPDVVVMDVMMPKMDGVEACREIMESAPETRVIMLTASTEEDAVVDAVAAGAAGYLQKDTDRERLLSAVRNVVLGELHLPGDVVRRVFEAIRGEGGTEDAAAGLTSRQREILVSFAQGYVLRSDCGGQGGQAGDRPKRHLRHPAKTEGSGRCRSWFSGVRATDCWTTTQPTTSAPEHAHVGPVFTEAQRSQLGGRPKPKSQGT